MGSKVPPLPGIAISGQTEGWNIEPRSGPEDLQVSQRFRRKKFPQNKCYISFSRAASTRPDGSRKLGVLKPKPDGSRAWPDLGKSVAALRITRCSPPQMGTVVGRVVQ